MLSEKRDEPAAARAFFEKAIGSNGLPDKVTMDKSGANKAGIDTINVHLALLLMLGGLFIQRMQHYQALRCITCSEKGSMNSPKIYSF